MTDETRAELAANDPDATRAQLRRLVQAQAAALREMTAQRDALIVEARRVAAWLQARAMDYREALGSENVARGLEEQARALEIFTVEVVKE